jgi:hypothetical protein
MDWPDVVAWIVFAVLAVPLGVMTLECVLALWPTRPVSPPDAPACPPCVVLIPAHDEEAVVARTLQSVGAQLRPGDRVLVVADNCTDGTADVARAHGAEVVERADPARRGKGYALAFGRDALAAAPPDVVVVLDADCTLGGDALRRLVRAAVAGRRPAQGSYRMVAPAAAGPERQVAAFAFVVKNLIRPLGLRRLGLPCLLMGTGMAFPWDVFRGAPLAHGHIVEDMGLTVDLALAGRPPVFVPEADILGEFPVDDRAAATQRRRWEHGHLRVIVACVPRLLGAAVRRGRVGLAALALDVGVPPLSALVLAAGAGLAALGGWAAAGGSWQPAAALAGTGLLALLVLAAAWWRSVLPARTLVRIPWYVANKIPLYFRFLIRPERAWVRTSRDHPPNPS